MQCHYSYSGCGLGSYGTDRLIQLVQEMQHNNNNNKSTQTDGSLLYGAKITGGGSGGTICVLGKNSPQTRQRITQVFIIYSKHFLQYFCFLYKI